MDDVDIVGLAFADNDGARGRVELFEHQEAPIHDLFTGQRLRRSFGQVGLVEQIDAVDETEHAVQLHRLARCLGSCLHPQCIGRRVLEIKAAGREQTVNHRPDGVPVFAADVDFAVDDEPRDLLTRVADCMRVFFSLITNPDVVTSRASSFPSTQT